MDSTNRSPSLRPHGQQASPRLPLRSVPSQRQNRAAPTASQPHPRAQSSSWFILDRPADPPDTPRPPPRPAPSQRQTRAASAAFQPQSRAPHRLLALRRSCPARMNQLLELSHGTDSSDVSTTDCDIAPPPTYPGSARKRMRKEGRTFGYDSSCLARGLAPGPFKWLAARQNINRQPLGEK